MICSVTLSVDSEMTIMTPDIMLLTSLACTHDPLGMQETIGDVLGDDELEEMRLRENEEAGQVDKNGSSTPMAPANTAGQAAKASKEQEQQPAKALQPPPGFSANHLFGDVEDDDPLDLVTNLSFLNDNEEVRPRLTRLSASVHTSVRSLGCSADMPLHDTKRLPGYSGQF